MDTELVARLQSIVGKEHVSTSYADRKVYSHVEGYAGDVLCKVGDVIVLPESTEEVVQIVRLANETETPVVPRGAGTNMSGMNIAHKGGIVLDISLMSKNLKIDEDNMIAVADAGYPVYKIMRELDKQGLRFPLSPLYTSGPQVGAAVACNITGNYGTKFGSMGDNVTGLEVVMPTGEVVVFGSGAYKDGPGFYHRYSGGPDLIGLFVNANGTTGIITKVAVRVRPRPEAEDILTFGWSREKTKEVTDVMYALQRHYVYDFFLVNRWNFQSAIDRGKLQLPLDTHFVAIISIEARSEEELAFERRRTIELCEKHGGKDLEELGKHTMAAPNYRMWQSVSPAFQRVYSLFFYCPINRFPQVYDLFESITKKHGLWNAEHCPLWYSFHGRNVMNPYPTIGIFNPMDPDQMARVEKWWLETNTELARLGCTQYNLGDSMPAETYERLGPLWELTRKLKAFLDPNGIMNPSLTYDPLTVTPREEAGHGIRQSKK